MGRLRCGRRCGFRRGRCDLRSSFPAAAIKLDARERRLLIGGGRGCACARGLDRDRRSGFRLGRCDRRRFLGAQILLDAGGGQWRVGGRRAGACAGLGGSHRRGFCHRTYVYRNDFAAPIDLGSRDGQRQFVRSQVSTWTRSLGHSRMKGRMGGPGGPSELTRSHHASERDRPDDQDQRRRSDESRPATGQRKRCVVPDPRGGTSIATERVVPAPTSNAGNPGDRPGRARPDPAVRQRKTFCALVAEHHRRQLELPAVPRNEVRLDLA